MNTSPLRNLLNAACRVYAICTVALCIGILLFGAEEMYIAPLNFMLLFPFAFLFAWANRILRGDRFSAGVRFLLHFLLVTAGVVLCLLLPAGTFSSGRSALVMVSLYLLVYLLAMLIAALIRRQIRRHRVMEESYTAQYQSLQEKK